MTLLNGVPVMARHLTHEECERVSQMVRAHCSQAEIARWLKRHLATISRELRRNCSPNGYWAASAQQDNGIFWESGLFKAGAKKGLPCRFVQEFDFHPAEFEAAGRQS